MGRFRPSELERICAVEGDKLPPHRSPLFHKGRLNHSWCKPPRNEVDFIR